MSRHVCPWWLAYTFDNPVRRIFHKPDKMFSAYLKEGMTAVDLGCGMGYFSIGMAKIVGESGKVISVDIQKKMLDALVRRARHEGVDNRIKIYLCDKDDIGIQESVDFALAFWMIHETLNEISFLEQVNLILNDSGKLFFAEPKAHVSLKEFEKTVSIAKDVGFKLIDLPNVYFSYAAVFEK